MAMRKETNPDFASVPRASLAERKADHALSKTASYPDQLAFVVAEDLGGIVTRADTGTTDVESHLRGMKKIVEKLFSSRGIQAVKRSTLRQ
jgi:hypothetical protein